LSISTNYSEWSLRSDKKRLIELEVAALTAREEKAAADAASVEAMAQTLAGKTDERRRSGSHYTPRSLTQPIVAETLRPIFERLGPQATPDQILSLRVLDPGMGSGAFLVEACRQLADVLVHAWETHGVRPELPLDEDLLLYAKRLVAQRRLYGSTVTNSPLSSGNCRSGSRLWRVITNSVFSTTASATVTRSSALTGGKSRR
jgi:hypothetical protein